MIEFPACKCLKNLAPRAVLEPATLRLTAELSGAGIQGVD